MNPAGIITTNMNLRKWKEWWFNVPLLVFQLAFMVAGTILGKIKWPKASLPIKVFAIIGSLGALIGVYYSIVGISSFFWSSFWVSLNFTILVCWVATYRNIDWRRVWQAAKVSHVRLVLEKVPDGVLTVINSYWTANFGWPKMEIQPWSEFWNDNKRFKYYDPTFPTPPEFMSPVIQYAHDQEGKRYNDVGLLSYFPHLIVWTIYPPCWGKELKIIKALNRPGALENCISGLVACLRWGESAGHRLDIHRFFAKELNILIDSNQTRHFKGYSTAVIPPCLAPLSKNWILKQEEK